MPLSRPAFSLPSRALALALSMGAVGSGCAADPAGDAPNATVSGAGTSETVVAAATSYGGAPDVVLASAQGPVALADLRGRPVVLHLSARDEDAAHAAFGEVAADLEASGAVVVAVVVEDVPAADLERLGYRGAPLVVVVDGEGVVRSRSAPTSGDALFAAAAPVLAEHDLAQTVAWPGADTVDDLVRAGGLVVDLGAAAPPPHALRVGMDSLSAETLPADLGTPLAFVGPDALAAARRAVGWGYAAVYAADAGGRLGAVEPELPARPPRSGGVRG